MLSEVPVAAVVAPRLPPPPLVSRAVPGTANVTARRAQSEPLAPDFESGPLLSSESV